MSIRSTVTFTVTINSDSREEAFEHVATVAGVTKAIFKESPEGFPPVTVMVGDVQINGENMTLEIEELQSPTGIQ